MQFKIKHNVLSEALKRVEKVVKPKHPVPILQGIYMELTEQELILIGSDNTESFRYHVPVDGENIEVVQPGKAVLAKHITDVVKKFKKDITLKLEGFNLQITSGRSEFNLTTFDPEEYPKLPEFTIEQSTFHVKGTEFNSFVRKTAFAASDSETRPILTGVCLHVKEDCMSFISTDSHRLGMVRVQSSLNKELKLVIAAKALDNMIKTFDLQEDVHFYCDSENQLILRNGPLVFYCRLLEGNYPDTSRLIPHDFKAEMKINRKAFLDEIELLRGMANSADNGNGGTIKLHVNGAATMSTYTAQTGKGQSVVDYESVEGTEKEFTISFSAKYMIEALKAIDDEFVMFKFNDAMRPFLLTPFESNLDEVQLVLPVRTY